MRLRLIPSAVISIGDDPGQGDRIGKILSDGADSGETKTTPSGRFRIVIGVLCLALLTCATGRHLGASEGGSAKEEHLHPAVFEPLRDDRLSSRSFQSSVYAIFQDSKGFLWIGTHIGLLKYDGYQIDQYSPNTQAETAISDINVSSIAEDRDGSLWIGSMDGGISRLDRTTDAFAHFRHDPDDDGSLSSDDVWCLYRSPSDDMWVGTWGGGLNRYDRKSGSFVRYRSDTGDPGSLSSDVVNAIFEDHITATIPTIHGPSAITT